MMPRHVRISFILFCVLTIMTGVIYPLVVTGMAQLFFPEKANGSLIQTGKELLGSELIGQPFSDPKYFWGRPSATTPFAYNAAASSGSNFGPLNKDYWAVLQQRVRRLQRADSLCTESIPADLVTGSGSGLDPHISVSAALYQVHRVASWRGMSEERIRSLIRTCTEDRQWGIFGEPRVNVLKINLALDDVRAGKEPAR
jgi:potassium-transporting ATPase KdpC subunit